MKFQPDNPELTAYALGELDASQAAAVAAAVKNSADSRQAVEETRETAGLLKSVLQTETYPALPPTQRAAIETALSSAPKVPVKNKPAFAQPSVLTAWLAWRPRFGTVSVWAAACLVTGIAWVLWFDVFCKSERDGSRVVTQFSAPEVPRFAVSPPPPPLAGRHPVVRTINPNLATTQAPRPAMIATALPSAAVFSKPSGRKSLTPVSASAARFGFSQNTGSGSMSAAGKFFGGDPFNTESYARIRDNQFLAVAEQPLSTFSIDVDTASYANVRRFLMQGSVPPRNAVRIEEMLNYFTYDYAKPKRGEPFSVNIEAAGCPWSSDHRLVRIGLKGKEVSASKRPPCNLVFLIDVSGSMADANKLSLIRPTMRMLVEQLTENERVAIVVYNEKARVLLHSTSGDRKQEIIDAIEGLQANGRTNGGDGIRLAYDMATRHIVERGVNRVILCTAGDFNVGTTELAELTR